MIIGESESFLGNFMGIWFFAILGLRFWYFFYMVVLYLGFLNLSLFIIWSFGGTISCCWESVVYNVIFLIGIYTVV